MKAAKENIPLPWRKTLHSYYFRSEWELYDLKKDPEELNNIVNKPSMNDTVHSLKQRLFDWQKQTEDPWICAPHAVLEDKGDYKNNPACLDLFNDKI